MVLRIQQWRPDIEKTEVVRDTRTGAIEIKGAVIAKAGVLKYRDGSGEWSELRDPKVMHSKEALASYDGQYVLLGEHPKKQDGKVTILTTENADKLPRIGTVRNPRPGTAIDPDTGKTVVVTRGDIRINTRAGVAAFNAGIRGFSAGYVADILVEEGEHEGEPYNKRQLTDIGNHLVLTANPRAGAITEVRMDTDDAICGSLDFDDNDDDAGTGEAPPPPPKKKRRRAMPKFNHKSTSYDVEPELIPVLEGLQARGDTLEEENTALKKQLAEKEGEIKALEAAAEAKGDTADEVEAKVEALLMFRDEVRNFLPTDYDFKGKTTLEVKGDAIEEGLGLTDLEEDEIPGAYKALLKSGKKAAPAEKPPRKTSGTKHTRALARAAAEAKGDTADDSKTLSRADAWEASRSRGFGPRSANA